ncbi:thioredoxin-like protein AAED1, chloroplastic isoform X2 [Amaranthus tricolor]|uniref:thioredoxin-like protein AAED1, chloroplastic isoform X2 n=1 Tax=Amaranthus tricolor TaxID=29722 RepID=UPI0025911B71|nr:thioredoxin-like protein AAED1, chloroplastic isoform X2 [Amaranthus tricolor]
MGLFSVTAGSGLSAPASHNLHLLSTHHQIQPSSFPTVNTSLSPLLSSASVSSLFTKSLSTPSSLTSRLVPRVSASVDVPENIGDILGDVTIFKASGEPVLFKDLWDQNEGIAVVALLRHFGCFCCWEFAADLKKVKDKFDAAGVKLIAVGVGSANKARMLGERLPFPMECLYADPERKAYDVLGLYYGLGRTFFNPASVFSRFESLKKAMENYTIEATPDDRSGVLQQGGMFVFKGKELLYARKDEGTGDHAPLDDVFNVCCNVPAAQKA